MLATYSSKSSLTTHWDRLDIGFIYCIMLNDNMTQRKKDAWPPSDLYFSSHLISKEAALRFKPSMIYSSRFPTWLIAQVVLQDGGYA